MQVMYTTATQHGFKDAPEALFIPLIGLAYGCAHLKYLLAQCDGNVEQALCQYNGGEGGNTKPPYRNAAYARKALAWYEQFKKEQDVQLPADVYAVVKAFAEAFPIPRAPRSRA